MFDLKIDGGLVASTNGEPRPQSIGITDGYITALGDLREQTATRTIDVDGAVVLPGRDADGRDRRHHDAADLLPQHR
jgi:predicted amidohydrolase YtcJ